MKQWQARTLLAWGVALALSACAPGGSGSPAIARPASPPGADAGAPTTTPPCRPQAAQEALGRKGSPGLAQAARLAAGAVSVRLIGHDEMVTKEYVASRLNLLLDEDGRVTKIYCG